MLAMASAETEGDESTKRVATRRLNDPVPDQATPAKRRRKTRHHKKAPR